MSDYVIMNTTNGDLEGGVFETREEAEEWINEQPIEAFYEIIERN